MPGATSENFDEHLNLMFDLMALAYQGNLTRIQSFMIAAEVSEQTYNHIGVPDAFHALSHHANDPAKKARLVKIQRYHTDVFAQVRHQARPRCPTATARCSITRCCCTAAT